MCWIREGGKIVTSKLIKVIGKAKFDFRGSVVNEKGRNKPGVWRLIKWMKIILRINI